MMINGMNSIMPGDMPGVGGVDQRQQMLEYLQRMGYDVGPMMPQGMPQIESPYGQPQSPYGPSEMPGGTGWDGVNAKIAWMAQNAMQKRQIRRENNRAMDNYAQQHATGNYNTPMSSQSMFDKIGSMISRIGR